MKKRITKVLGLALCGAIVSSTMFAGGANASTSASYNVPFAHGEQRATLTVYGDGTAAIGSYQNYTDGHVYTKCVSNVEKNDARGRQNASFTIRGTSFSTYHELVGGGWTNHYYR